MLKNKTVFLEKILTDAGKIAVAFSGGVDSTFLLKFAIGVLGRNNVIAITEKGELYPEEEISDAVRFARLFRVKQFMVVSNQLQDPRFVRNPVQRCFHCKKELFGSMIKIARAHGFATLVDGSNADDTKDFRPGMKAKKMFGVHSPLQEAGITKDEIRNLSKKMGLPTWNKPSFACLASRIPYGEKITKERLSRIENAERYLKGLGISQVRVRDYRETCRIELLPSEFLKIMPKREKVVKRLKDIGYMYVTLDLEGYKTGSMNKPLFGYCQKSDEKIRN